MATPVEADSFASKYPILKNWKTIVISCLASMFEFYDFGVLGFFTKEIGQALLPSDLTEMEYNVWGYGLFWAGFFTRPFGGALFGYIGDNYGRKKAFRLSIITMALCTFATGCIPTYQVIGIFAPLILLLLRLIQGLSTGGEITSVFVYLYEIAPKHRRAFWMSLMVISSVGAFLATIIKIIINNTLTEQEINSWGWRIPFWFGILLLLLGWWSKYELKRTPIFEHMIHIERERDNDMRHEREDNSQYEILPNNPFTIACCHNFPISITLTFATALNHIIPYMFNVFLPDYLHSVPMHGWSDYKSYQFNAYLMVTGSVVIVIVGINTDKYGPLRYVIIYIYIYICIYI